MPILDNAKKALRQSKVRAQRNKIVRDEIHSLRRKFRKHLEAKEVAQAKEMIPTLDQKLDKLVTKGLWKKNKVARVKSRLNAAIARVQK